jgi:hypothetical protein
MDNYTLLFWRAGSAVKLSPAEIARELMWGEEVDGLIDLNVRDILDRLKAEFPDCQETAGQFLARAAGGSFEATWTWQYFRIDCRDLPLFQREEVVATFQSFGCLAYDPQLSQP